MFKAVVAKTHQVPLVVFVGLICLPLHGHGAQILSYGFEDWQGYDGNNSPAPGYIYTHSDANTWQIHHDSTTVTMGGVACGGNSAYAGSYYHHVQFNDDTEDPCLGRIATSVNGRNNMGYNGSYPLGAHDTTHFGSLLTGPTAVLRFMFRTTDDWTSAQTGIDGGGGLKFVRWAIGRNYFGDDNNILVKIRNDGGATYPRFGIFNRGDNSTTLFTPTVNWQDGNWHAFTLHVERTAPGAYDVTIYLDAWEMSGPPLGSVSTTVPSPEGGGYYSCSFGGNWSARHPPNLMGIDFDNIEVWDSLPESVGTPPVMSAPSPTGQLFCGE